MPSGVYAEGLRVLLKNTGGIRWDDGALTLNAVLLSNAYTENLDTHDFLNDVSANRLGSDVAVGSRSITLDAANNRVHLANALTITFNAVAGGATAKGVAVYRSTGSEATSELICWNEFTSTVATNGSNIQVTFDTDGIGDGSGRAVRLAY